jgi:putative transposase
MPNHFHLLVHANENSVKEVIDGSFRRQQFSQSIKQPLSSYTKAINKQESRTGSLFQQKTKAVCVSEVDNEYTSIAFHYIHQNPLKSKLVDKMEDWEFSSFRDYVGQRPNTMCNLSLARKILDINFSNLYTESYQVISFKGLRCPTP